MVNEELLTNCIYSFSFARQVSSGAPWYSHVVVVNKVLDYLLKDGKGGRLSALDHCVSISSIQPVSEELFKKEGGLLWIMFWGFTLHTLAAPLGGCLIRVIDETWCSMGRGTFGW